MIEIVSGFNRKKNYITKSFTIFLVNLLYCNEKYSRNPSISQLKMSNPLPYSFIITFLASSSNSNPHNPLENLFSFEKKIWLT